MSHGRVLKPFHNIGAWDTRSSLARISSFAKRRCVLPKWIRCGSSAAEYICSALFKASGQTTASAIGMYIKGRFVRASIFHLLNLLVSGGSGH